MTMDGGFPLSQSPRTQSFQMEAPPQDEKEFFSSKFRDLAYTAFQKTQPQLFPQVITFRVLAVDAPNGEGVGSFIVRSGSEILFVPVVISDNAVKPLDMCYVRSKDRFYPLTFEWVEKVQTESVSALGDGVKPPKDLNTDVDIRNVIVPPTAGRYSYAALEQESVAPFRAAHRFEREKTASPELKFPELLSRLPDGVKVAAAAYYKKHVRVFRKLAEVYGVKTLEMSLRTTPVAKVAHDNRLEVAMKHDVYTASASTPLQELKKELGPGEVGEAYKATRLHGFYIKDRRKGVPNDLEVISESTFALEQPKSTGMYRVFLSDGTAQKALVVVNPQSPGGMEGDGELLGSSRYRSMPQPYYGDARQDVLVLLPDGRCGEVTDLLAEPIATTGMHELKEFVDSLTSERPSNDEHGLLIYADGTVVKATREFRAVNVSSNAEMVSFHADYQHGNPIIISKKLKGSTWVRPPGQDTMLVSGDFRWFKAKTETKKEEWDAKPRTRVIRLMNSDFLSRADLIDRMVEMDVVKTASSKIYCVKHGNGFVTAPGAFPLSALEASVKLASDHGITVSDASRVVEATYHGLPFTAYAVPKTAADDKPKKKAPDTEVSPDPAGDAAMMANMPPPAPPPPSGMELALAEKMQTLQMQQAALQQMTQLVQELQMRAQMIDGAGGEMAAPMAAAGMMAGPADPNAMAPLPGMGGQGDPQAAPPGQPVGAPPPMADPNAMGGAPPPGGDPAALGGAPPPMGGAPPGGDPAAMGGDPAAMGGDPAAMGGMGAPPPPPPQAMMPEEPNPALFEQEVNPDFVESAGQLNDAGVFDAAAVASLANVRSVKDLLQNYLPVLDNALDRMGRTLLLLYVKSREIRERIGEEAYTQLEQKVRDTFRLLGDSLMAIEQYGDQMLPRGVRRA